MRALSPCVYTVYLVHLCLFVCVWLLVHSFTICVSFDAVLDQMTVPSFDDEGNGGQILVEWACNTCYGCEGLSTPGSCQVRHGGGCMC